MLQIVARAYFRKNQAIEENVLQLTAQELKLMLVGEFFYLTIEEVEYAFELGVYGKLGEYYGINLVTFKSWLQCYSGSQERLNVIAQRNRGMLKIAPTATITDKEKECICRNYVIEDFNRYKETNNISNIGGVTYRYLDSKCLIEASVEKKWKVYYDCLAKITSRKTGIKQSTKSLKEIVNNGIKSEAVSEGQRVLISEFFDQLINSDSIITDYI